MNYKLSKTAVALSVLIGTQAQATIITLDLTGSTSAETGMGDTSDTKSGSDSVVAFSEVLGEVSSAGANARANDDGWFYSTAGGDGEKFVATSMVEQMYTVENDGDDQFFDFSFNVMNGSLNADCGFGDDGYGDEGEFLQVASVGPNDRIQAATGCGVNTGVDILATYSARILFNGIEVWNSFAQLELDENDTSFMSAGTQLGTYNDGNRFFSWGPQSFDIALGLIGAGETFELSYQVTTSVAGAGGTFFGRGYAQFGDPNEFNTTGQSTFASRTANPVPVSGTLGILGIALGGLAFARRRK